MKKRYVPLIILALIVLLGFGLRFYDLDKENLWFDEGYTILSINQDNIGGVIDQAEITETKPSVYFIILHLWSEIFGLSMFALRFFSLLCGVISIILLYLLAKELFDKKVAILSALLISISLFDIIYSQEARVFSFFTTLTILSFFIFVKLIKGFVNKDSKKSSLFLYFFFGVVGAFLNAIHYFGLLIFLVQNIILLSLFYKKGTSLKRWFISQLIIILLFILDLNILQIIMK